MFPDPQFKSHNERRRVVSTVTACEYAFYLRSGAFLLTCTDVEPLSLFMHEQIARSGRFQHIPADECKSPLVLTALQHMDFTADAERHQRKDSDKRVFKAVWAKI